MSLPTPPNNFYDLLCGYIDVNVLDVKWGVAHGLRPQHEYLAVSGSTSRPLSPNPPKRVSIAAGAWVRDVSKWRCGYDVSAWVVLKVRGRDFGRQWRPTVAIWGEFDESAGNSGHPRSGPERSYGQDRLWCVRWSVVDTAVRPAEEWLAVWSVRDRTVFPRASAAGDAK